MQYKQTQHLWNQKGFIQEQAAKFKDTKKVPKETQEKGRRGGKV